MKKPDDRALARTLFVVIGAALAFGAARTPTHGWSAVALLLPFIVGICLMIGAISHWDT